MTGARGHTGIDAVIDAGREKLTAVRAGRLVEAITRIEELCRGRERTEMGFFRVGEGGGG